VSLKAKSNFRHYPSAFSWRLIFDPDYPKVCGNFSVAKRPASGAPLSRRKRLRKKLKNLLLVFPQDIIKAKKMKNHNHDLVHQLSEVLDSIWRFDNYIRTAAGCQSCTTLWQKLKSDYQQFEKLLSSEIKKHLDEGRFD